MAWPAEQIEACEPDVMRSMVKMMAEALMSAEADAVCRAGYGQRSNERVNRRSGYRVRDLATRQHRGRRSRSCAAGPTSPSGCWNAAGPSRPW
ncbi:transposase [Actinomadura madurae]|uniref:transposase n=1 Tax=Actinomadura madurae TaxID=1993 RepID=UPI00399BA91A